MTRPTRFDYRARAEACQEAAEHLGMSWTDDPTELEAGRFIAAMLRRESDKWAEKAEQAEERAGKEYREEIYYGGQ